ncbi:MAG: hypothetical protein DRJ03_06570 [Chloroflexi bacterium]|nr:MAG: hypothetical protein B6I35_02205 [Anaerolineaceae bacterium 4572_32.2]RLC81539.1 MAG: hypothetical protein DRI81_02160 [Chloroflexota bacterium]RLC87239.1 MAG: hypothetical protein DRJ03_06570 [Chloroflexota bacterium]HEY73943.1 GAF domain-containing protein [Thermoflexia bacterium]
MNKKQSPTFWSKLGFNNWSIRFKLLVVMLILSLVPLIAAVWISTTSSAEAITQQTRISLSRLAYSTAQRIEQFLIDNHNFIRMAAGAPEVVAFLSAPTEEEQSQLQNGVDGVVANLLSSDPAIDLVGFYDLEGDVVSHNNPAIVGRNYLFRDYVQAALSGEQFTSGIQRGWTTDTPGINASAPVAGETEVIGAIATRIQGEFLTDILRSTLNIESEEITAEERESIDIFLVNEYGIIVGHSDESDWIYRSLGTIESQEILDAIAEVRLLGGSCPEGADQCDASEKTPRLPEPIPTAQPLADILLKAIQSGEAGSAHYCHPRNAADAPGKDGQCDGTPHVVGYAPVRDPFAPANLFMVVVDVPEEIFLRSIAQQRRQGVLITAAMVTLTIVASLVVARTLAQPIGKLAAAAQNVENDEPFEPEEIADVTAQGDEIGNLARVFSDMVLSLRARMAELRTVYEIGQDITATLEVDETLQAILDRVRDVVTYDAAEITLFDQREQKLIVTAWSGAGGFADTRGRKYELNKGFTGLIGQERRSLLVADTQAEDERKAVTVKLTDDAIVRSLLGVPLLIRDRLVGTLELTSKRVGAFNKDDQRLLETIAPQAAIAIEKAQQVREREQKLKNQIQQLRIEIDEVKRRKQVEQIVETDYFQTLREKARSMREHGAGETTPATDGV